MLNLFRLNIKNLTELEKKIYYEVISHSYGVGAKEIENMAQAFNTTERKVEEIILKLEIDGFFQTNSNEYN